MLNESEKTVTEDGSALRRAAIAGDVETLHALLNQGVPIDITDPNGWTVLILAVKRGKAEVVHYLVKRGAEVNRRTKSGTTALYHAAQRGHAGIVRFLLHSGANVNERYEDGATPLIMGAYHLEVVRILIAAGAEIEASDDWGNTALLRAAISGSSRSVFFLMDKGAVIRLHRNPSAWDQPRLDMQRLITWAKMRKQDELVRRLETAIVYEDEDEAKCADG